MSKPIDAPELPAVPLWDDGPDLDRPDASFHDDHVGGRVKSEEAARQRAVADRFLQQQPKRILDEGVKIIEAGAFRPAQEDEAQQRARREGRKFTDVRRTMRPQSGTKTMSQQELEVHRIEARVEYLLAHMEALGDAGGQGGPEPLPDARAQAQATRLQKLEREAKFQLQHLLAGGVGMTFMADPRLTFRRLFERISRWPPQVRPGRRPETEADIDAFLAWVFEPEGGYAGIEPF